MAACEQLHAYQGRTVQRIYRTYAMKQTVPKKNNSAGETALEAATFFFAKKKRQVKPWHSYLGNLITLIQQE